MVAVRWYSLGAVLFVDPTADNSPHDKIDASTSNIHISKLETSSSRKLCVLRLEEVKA